jgi:hypothetical protein
MTPKDIKQQPARVDGMKILRKTSKANFAKIMFDDENRSVF